MDGAVIIDEVMLGAGSLSTMLCICRAATWQPAKQARELSEREERRGYFRYSR
jgi:hypothetical protein